jgi:excisionase family DNA binding protein
MEEYFLKENLSIAHKYSLSVSEAALYFGIGEKRLRAIINENQGADYILEIGTHIRIKREKFEEYLNNATAL